MAWSDTPAWGDVVTIIHTRVAASIVAVLALAMTLVPTLPVEAEDDLVVPYLALGDSVPYGWDVVTQPVSSPPADHVGYPERLAARSPLVVTNASCPGETSTSFIDGSFGNGCGFVKSAVGVKVAMEGRSQLEFAVDFLAATPDTGLVSLQLGANDLFLCRADDGCTPEEFVDVLGVVAGNITTTVLTLRSTGYDGPIVLVAYYALDYGDPTEVAVSSAFREVLSAIAAVDALGDVVVADGFAAFEQASRRADGDVCEAGLILPLPGAPGTCNIHPTPDGDRVLAQAVHRAIDMGAIASAADTGG